MNSELPNHMPVDMALAPNQKPYEHTHVIHTPPVEHDHKLSQHSLSPEKLGLVGYVKDVAGFVKDAVHERREKRITRRNSATEEERPKQEEKQRRRSSAEVPQEQVSVPPLAGVVKGLFPGVETNAVGCTHADDLRTQMMHVNDDHKLL
ncbi:uncharacterized protein B0P05DRAFT_594936 [Gilbertella persicaria]|uniref:uncharacterized protein n=1 Tax=Gilbertella persicaria TaxID=101096 RepID=UPI0022201453|nr:uncharacterized protein B0P05DRAFT_594936 [Gilbertella persicaria]KAI8087692.1 hypothetical protein B0P05DRAFT_594936 [Gilbertella persicaria]